MSNPAEDIKNVFDGISGAVSGLGRIMQQNDMFERILIQFLVANGYDMNGYSIRHFDRDGYVEVKLPAYCVSKGIHPDTLVHIKKALVTKWAADNRPDLLPNAAPSRPVINVQQ
jgi:hypothetical protein